MSRVFSKEFKEQAVLLTGKVGQIFVRSKKTHNFFFFVQKTKSLRPGPLLILNVVVKF